MRTTAVLLSFLVVLSTFGQATSPQALLDRGMDAYRSGDYAAAVTDLQAAAQGFLSPDRMQVYVNTGKFEQLDKLETALVYLALAQDRLGREADARETVLRLLSAERIAPTYSRLQIADAADFNALAAELVPSSTLARPSDVQIATATPAPAESPTAPLPAVTPVDETAPLATVQPTQIAEAAPAPETPAAPVTADERVPTQRTVAEERAERQRIIDEIVARERERIQREADARIAEERQAAERAAAERIAAAEQESSQRVAAVQTEAQQKISAVEAEAQQRAAAAEAEARQRIETTQRDAEARVAAVQKEAQERLTVTEADAAARIVAAQREAEQRVAEAQAAAQRDAEARIAAIQRETEQRIAAERTAAERAAAAQIAEATASARRAYLTSLRQAEAFANSGDLDDANAIYLRLAGSENVPREILAEAAVGLYRTGSFRNAVTAFQRMGTFAKGEEDLRYYNAVALYETGHYKEAQKELSCALPFIQVTDDVTRYRVKIEQTAQQTALVR